MGLCITGEAEKLHLQSKLKMILGMGLSWNRCADVVVALSSTTSNTSTIDADPLSALLSIAGVDTVRVQIGVQSTLEQLRTCYNNFLELESGYNASVLSLHKEHASYHGGDAFSGCCARASCTGSSVTEQTSHCPASAGTMLVLITLNEIEFLLLTSPNLFCFTFYPEQ